MRDCAAGYDRAMGLDRSQQADQIVLAEKARRPRWRNAAQRAPSWFSGGELEVLEAPERNDLYQLLRSRTPSTYWFLTTLATANFVNVIRSLHSNRGRTLWIAVAIGYALAILGAWLYRRRSIVAAGRRELRESADWPLRILNRKP